MPPLYNPILVSSLPIHFTSCMLFLLWSLSFASVTSLPSTCPYRFYFYNGLVDSRSSPILLNGLPSFSMLPDYEALPVRLFSITRLRSHCSSSSQDHRLSPLSVATIRFRSSQTQTLLLIILIFLTTSPTRVQHYRVSPPSMQYRLNAFSPSVSSLMLGSSFNPLQHITGLQPSSQVAVPRFRLLHCCKPHLHRSSNALPVYLAIMDTDVLQSDLTLLLWIRVALQLTLCSLRLISVGILLTES